MTASDDLYEAADRIDSARQEAVEGGNVPADTNGDFNDICMDLENVIRNLAALVEVAEEHEELGEAED